MHPKKARSDRLRTRETSPLQSLGAPDHTDQLTRCGDARSPEPAAVPQDNLGNRTKPGVAYRVGKHSRGSLHRASFHAQKLAESFPVSDRTAPAYSPRKACLSKLLLSTLLLRRVPDRSFTQNIPPPSFGMWCFSLELK